jgi:hypothetical protein
VTQVERMFARRAPLTEILDAIARYELTVSSRLKPALLSYRIVALEYLQRSDHEIEAALEAFLEADRAANLIENAPDIISACATRPALAERHIVPLVAQLEVLPGQDQTPLKEILAMARQVCARLGVAAG